LEIYVLKKSFVGVLLSSKGGCNRKAKAGDEEYTFTVLCILLTHHKKQRKPRIGVQLQPCPTEALLPPTLTLPSPLFFLRIESL